MKLSRKPGSGLHRQVKVLWLGRSVAVIWQTGRVHISGRGNFSQNSPSNVSNPPPTPNWDTEPQTSQTAPSGSESPGPVGRPIALSASVFKGLFFSWGTEPPQAQTHQRSQLSSRITQRSKAPAKKPSLPRCLLLTFSRPHFVVTSRLHPQAGIRDLLVHQHSSGAVWAPCAFGSSFLQRSVSGTLASEDGTTLWLARGAGLLFCLFGLQNKITAALVLFWLCDPSCVFPSPLSTSSPSPSLSPSSLSLLRSLVCFVPEFHALVSPVVVLSPCSRVLPRPWHLSPFLPCLSPALRASSAPLFVYSPVRR